MINDILSFDINISTLTDEEKKMYLLNEDTVYNVVAKTCHNISFYIVNSCIYIMNIYK